MGVAWGFPATTGQAIHTWDRFGPGSAIGHPAAGQAQCVEQAIMQHYRHETGITLVVGRGMGEVQIQQAVGCTSRHEATPWPGRWYHSGSRETRVTKPKEGRGWVYIPHFFDLNRVHRLLRKWKIGEQCKLTVRRDEFNSQAHAVNYIVKYLIKMSERGCPRWVHEHTRLRFIQGSRTLGRLTDGEYRPPKQKQKPVERIAECGVRISFIAYDPATDRHRIIGSYYGNRDNLKSFPGIVIRQNFDFTRQRSFEVYGFPSQTGVRAFEQVATLPEVEVIALAGINKKTRFLSTWDALNRGHTNQTG